MTLASAWVTHGGPLVSIEGNLPAHAERMIRNAGAFEYQGKWFCKEAAWDRVGAALRASGVTVRLDQAGVVHKAVLGLEPGGTGRLEGTLPRKVERTWLGRSQGRAFVGITPYALQDVQERLEEDGVDLSMDAPCQAMMRHMDDVSAAVIHALGMPETALPDVKLLTGALRPYQRRALAVADACNGRMCLWDEPGVGKTLTAIGYSLHRKVERVLVVCPSAVKGQWRDEVGKFAGGATFIMQGRARSPVPTNTRWVIVNPDLLHDRFEDLRAWNPGFVVVDEAHKHRTPDAQRVVALGHLARQAPLYMPMSGTPVENKPINIWVHLNLTQPRWWGTYHDFGMAFCAPKRNHWASERAGFNIYDYPGVTAEAKPVLRSRLRHVMLRRTIDEVGLELPKQTRTMVRVSLEPAAQKEYEQVKAEYAKAMKQALAGATTQASIDRALLQMQSERAKYAMRLRRIASLGRIQDTLERVESLVEAGERPIVFAYFRETLEALASGLKKLKVKTGLLHGGTSRREEVVQAFLDGNTQVLVAQIEVGGTGLNLQGASRVTVTHELSFVPIHIRQSEGRVYRSGQTRPVQHIYMIGEGTVDERVLEVTMRKMASANELLEDGEGGTEDEILRRLEAEFFQKTI